MNGDLTEQLPRQSLSPDFAKSKGGPADDGAKSFSRRSPGNLLGKFVEVNPDYALISAEVCADISRRL